MRLIRNTTQDGRCKYALVRLDKLRADGIPVDLFIQQLGDLKKYLELGEIGTENEFFAIKLKDVNSLMALESYAVSAYAFGDKELGEDVYELLTRAGRNSPFCKKPD